MQGRRPKPTQLKLVTGNPGRKPLNNSEAKPDRVIPDPPDHMSAKALTVWKHVAPMLSRIGVLTEADGIGLELLCEAYADCVTARRALQEAGSNYYETETQTGAVMYRVHPAVAVVQDADRRIKSWLIEFGMTPAARARVRTVDQKPEDPDTSGDPIND